jgi:hypothetical protein
MNHGSPADLPRPALQLDFLLEDPEDPDPDAVSAAAGDAIHDLRHAGYTVAPAYTGEKGGELFEVIRQGVQDI